MSRSFTVVHALEKNRLTTGSVVQMMDAARGLALRGHRVSVVSRPGGDLETACHQAGVRFQPLALRHGLDVVSAIRWRCRWQGAPPDLVHVHKGRPHGIVLMAAAGLGRRPVVVVNRGVTFPLDRFNRWKYRHPRVKAVVCVADAVRDVVHATAGVRADRLCTIYAGTDTERFHPDRADGSIVRQELGLADSQLLVAQVSVREWKGWRDLLLAAARLPSDMPSLTVLLVGCSASEEPLVLGWAADLGIHDRVRCVPYRSDMPEVLSACDVVVDASRDGTGITGTIREAMALQRPVVATRCGGNSELIEDGRSGILTTPGEVDELTAALRQLLCEPDLRRTLGHRARQRVVDGFSTATRLDRLERLYATLLAEGDAVSGS